MPSITINILYSKISNMINETLIPDNNTSRRTDSWTAEKFVQEISYRDRGEQYLNYSPLINPDSGNELRDFIRGAPLLGTVYEMSRDKEPVQLYDGRIKITWSASRGNSSVINGLVRRLVKFLKE